MESSFKIIVNPSITSCWWRKLLSHRSSDTVNMPFEVAVMDQLGENALHKGGNGARIESELGFVYRYKMLGKYHIADTQRGRDGFRKSIEVNHVIVGRKCEKRCYC